MADDVQRTITEVLNLKTGQFIQSEAFFSQPEDEVFQERYRLEESIKKNERYLVCPYCQQSVKIRGKLQGLRTLHFAHLRDSDDCPIKTSQHYTEEEVLKMKYNGLKESDAHLHMKHLLAKSLRADPAFSDVMIEEIFRDKGGLKEWKKPDISAKVHGTDIVFEIQLSTTFLSVLVERDIFYKKNHTYIGWIFNDFTANIDEQRFTEKDILYSNNCNAFIVNNQTCQHSEEEQKFYLVCHYLEPVIQDRHIVNEWRVAEVCFHDLTFQEDSYKFYYYDYEGEKALREAELQKIIEQEEYEARQRKADIQKKVAELQQAIREKEGRPKKEKLPDEPGNKKPQFPHETENVGDHVPPEDERSKGEAEDVAITSPPFLPTVKSSPQKTYSVPPWNDPSAIFQCEICGGMFGSDGWTVLDTGTNLCKCKGCVKEIHQQAIRAKNSL